MNLRGGVRRRRGVRLMGSSRVTPTVRYVVAEMFPSISDTEDNGVEFCERDEA